MLEGHIFYRTWENELQIFGFCGNELARFGECGEGNGEYWKARRSVPGEKSE